MSGPWSMILTNQLQENCGVECSSFIGKSPQVCAIPLLKGFQIYWTRSNWCSGYSFFIHFYFQNYTNIGKLTFFSILAISNSVMIIKYLPFQSANPHFWRWHFTSLTIIIKEVSNIYMCLRLHNWASYRFWKPVGKWVSRFNQVGWIF